MNSLGYEYQSPFARRYFAEGKEEGRAEGRVEIILRQLTLRFGLLTEPVQARVRGACETQLDDLAERILTARTLDEAVELLT